MNKDFWKNLEALTRSIEGAGEEVEHHLYRHERLEQYRSRVIAYSDIVFLLVAPLVHRCSVMRTSLPTAALADQRMIFIF